MQKRNDTRAKVLCLAPNWVGDAVMALPAIRMLADAGIGVDVLARASVQRVFHAAAGVSRLLLAKERRVARWRQGWQLRTQIYAAVVLFTPAWSAAASAILARAPRRIGRRGDLRRLLLTHALPVDRRKRHLALAYQELAATTLDTLGVPRPVGRRAAAAEAPGDLYALPRLVVQPDEREAARHQLVAAGLAAAARPIVVAPGARYGAAKRYPAERFAAAASLLQAELKEPVVLVGSAADADETRAVQAQLPGSVDLAGRTAMGALLGILETASGVLSNDSGVMHLAAALGAPVVGVFGSSNPEWTRPLGERAAFVYHKVVCSPCYAPTCARDFACMLEIAPSTLAQALGALRTNARTVQP